MNPPAPTRAAPPSPERVTFRARSVPDAVAQVRARLGPEAVVLEVRPVPTPRRCWPWRRPRPCFDVVACPPPDAPGRLDAVSDAPASPCESSRAR